MPTMTRPPAAPAMTPDGVVTLRAGDGPTLGAPVSPPGDLLPSGGPARIEPGAGRGPAEETLPATRRRADDAFRRHVRRIHRQLLPVGSRTALASSYGREAAGRSAGPDTLEPARAVTALQVAYALRWLELAEPVLTPPTVLDWRMLLER